MPRLTFPNGEDRLIYQTGISPGLPLNNANGTKFNVYTDLACTTLANIQNADGSVNAASQVIVDGQSSIPLFLGPVDGTDVLYLRVDNTLGNGYRIHARYDDRIDTVVADVATKANDAAVVHKAGGDTITASGAAVIPLVVQGAASQTANLLEARNSAGTVLASVTKDAHVDTVGTARALSGVLGGRATFATATARNEMHAKAAGENALVVRGAAGQSAALTEWQTSAGVVTSFIFEPGFAGFGTSTILDGSNGNASTLSVAATNVARSCVVVRGAAGQTAKLAEFQNSAGTVLASVSQAGGLVSTPNVAGHNALFGSAATAATVPLVMRGAASQTANLAEFQTSTGALRAAIKPDGLVEVTDAGGAGTITYSGYADSANLGAYAARIRVLVNGAVRYIPAYL